MFLAKKKKVLIKRKKMNQTSNTVKHEEVKQVKGTERKLIKIRKKTSFIKRKRKKEKKKERKKRTKKTSFIKS